MKIDVEMLKKQFKYLKDLIIWFNKQPSIVARSEITGAVNTLAILLDAGAEVHFSVNDPSFLTYISFHNGLETVYTVSALASDITIPEDSKLGKAIKN